MFFLYFLYTFWSCNNTQKFDLSNVLLTGVTGFLGIHLLYELLNKKNVKKIYCIIRAKDFKNANERFQEKIKYYFDNVFRRTTSKLLEEKNVENISTFFS